MSINALVTDCHTKHGFAIARSLRQKGLGVISHYPNKISPFFLSLRNRPKIVCSLRNQEQLENFISCLEKNRPEVLIPVSNLSVKIISDHREQISKFTKVLLPGKDSLDIAQNKNKTFRLAEKLGIRCPKTIYDTKSISDFNVAIENISFPVVLKYTNVNETGVRYCKTIEEIKSILDKYNNTDDTPPILQEFIEGEGVGFYALYKNEKCLSYFMHKRIHEYPVTGGSSSFAMSIFNEELKSAGLKILDSLKWNGIAMVEFKLTNKNELFLIEINPKFWGSYELSEKCGINFAYNYYKAALGESIAENEYEVDIGFRWLFSEIMYFRDKLFLRKKGKKSTPNYKLKNIYNDLYIDEPLILIAKIFDVLIRIFIKKANPHSIP